jgi:hypothetical protein
LPLWHDGTVAPNSGRGAACRDVYRGRRRNCRISPRTWRSWMPARHG